VTDDAPTEMQQAIARFMETMASGDHVFSALQMTDVDVPGAEIAVDLEIDHAVTGPRGALQGGVIATLADFVGGRLAMQGVDPEAIVVTTDLTVHYLTPLIDGPAHAVGTTLRRAKRAIVVRVDVYDGAGGALAAACTLAFKVVRSS
jgi:uncharacterized protein (TIGR00369 family)